MLRFLLPMIGLAVVSAGLGAAPPAGSWKLTLKINRQPVILLVAFTESNGRWAADFIDATAEFKTEPKFESFSVRGEVIQFTLSLDDQPFVDFDGVLTKDGQKILGSSSFGGGSLELTELRPSKLKKLDDGFELMRETLAQTEVPGEVYEATQVVLSQARAKKLPAEEVRSLVDRATRLAIGYGTRWERNVTIKLASLLLQQTGYDEIALALARKAERMLVDEDAISTRLEVLSLLRAVLRQANKLDEAKQYDTQIARLEARDFQEYAKTNPPFPIEEYNGRKSANDRVVLVEIVSSAEAVQSAAFDLARDALLKTFKPSEVLVLSYHMHIPGGADPMANRSALERLQYYSSAVQRGVFSFVNGKRAVQLQQDTNAKSAQAVYTSLREKIIEELEKPAGAKLALQVQPTATGYSVQAVASEIDKPSEQLFLRFAVVEDRVRYGGGNGIRYHTQVVRATLGGRGVPLTQAKVEETITIDINAIRDSLAKYLADAEQELEFSRSERPLELKNLTLVAYVQNDSTGDILAATSAPLKAK